MLSAFVDTDSHCSVQLTMFQDETGLLSTCLPGQQTTPASKAHLDAHLGEIHAIEQDITLPEGRIASRRPQGTDLARWGMPP